MSVIARGLKPSPICSNTLRYSTIGKDATVIWVISVPQRSRSGHADYMKRSTKSEQNQLSDCRLCLRNTQPLGPTCINWKTTGAIATGLSSPHSGHVYLWIWIKMPLEESRLLLDFLHCGRQPVSLDYPVRGAVVADGDVEYARVVTDRDTVGCVCATTQAHCVGSISVGSS